MTEPQNEMWVPHFSRLLREVGFHCPMQLLARRESRPFNTRTIQYPNNRGSAVVKAGI
jgi:hypothetical protein